MQFTLNLALVNCQLFQPTTRRPFTALIKRALRWLCLDATLTFALLALELIGLLVLYSASNQSLAMVGRQFLHFLFAFICMVLFAKIPPERYQEIIPWLYGISILALLYVAFFGLVNKGGQRWINLAVIRFQPSEVMKLAMPMMLAWYLREKELPLTFNTILVCFVIIGIPIVLILRQPDLGTAVLVGLTAILVLLLAGIERKVFWSGILANIAMLPITWHLLYPYQKMRILIFLSPERDPLGHGYNIIQSKIALGSGGFWGQGWLSGSQSHLKFLPESTTDFAIVVFGEEFGFIGYLLLFLLIAIVVGRSLYISMHAQTTFSRLLSGSLVLSFFGACFVNLGMVSSLLPVVGVPFPFISYGGSAMLIFMLSFGIIMSVNSHRKLISC